MKKTGEKNEQGRSMIEMLGVLAIVGVLSVGGLLGYNMAMRRYRVQKAVDEFFLLLQQVEYIYADAGNAGKDGVLKGIDSSDFIKAINGVEASIRVVVPYRYINYPFDWAVLFYPHFPEDLCLAFVTIDAPRLSIGADSIGYYKFGTEAARTFCVGEKRTASTYNAITFRDKRAQ